MEALRKHPDLNAHWTDEGHWRRQAVNIGVAVAVDDGLIVPVIRDADQLSLHGLNMAINDVADRCAHQPAAASTTSRAARSRWTTPAGRAAS